MGQPLAAAFRNAWRRPPPLRSAPRVKTVEANPEPLTLNPGLASWLVKRRVGRDQCDFEWLSAQQLALAGIEQKWR